MRVLNMLKHLSIRTKLVTAFIFVLLLMASVSGVQMRLFSGYIEDYNQMLEGIAKANAINGLVKTDLDSEIRAITNGQKKFKDGKQYELLKIMDEQLKQINANETDAQTLKQITSVGIMLESLRVKIDKLGNLIETKSSVDQQTGIFDTVVIINTSIQEGVKEVIRQKLVASELRKQQIMVDFTKGVWIYGVAFTLVIFLSFMTAWLISGSISKPLRRLSRSSTEMANGNLALARVVVNNKDEIGQLCEAFNRMLDNIRSIITSVHETNYRVNESSESLFQGIQENKRAGEEIAIASQNISESLQAQNDLVRYSTGEFEKLFNSFRGILDYSEKIESHTIQSLHMANEGTKQIGDFIVQFSQLSHTVEQVDAETDQLKALTEDMADLLKMIKDIASQTNVLSINASIEASRESQAGRSFTVIAARIKQLAEQTKVLATKVDDKMLIVRQRVDVINRQMKNSMEQLLLGGLKASAVKAEFESILQSNASVQQDVGTINQDMKEAGERMHKTYTMFSKMEEMSEKIQVEINGIAAMSQEQVATLQEVSSSSDILVDQNTEMKRVVSIFSISNN